jgi:hypothetical protein
MSSNTQRSLAYYRKRGYYAEKTEHTVRLPGGMVYHKDLHGFIDVVVLNEDEKINVQSTGWANMADRLNKIRTETTGLGKNEMRISTIARWLLKRGERIVIQGWKDKNKGKGRARWVSKEREVIETDFWGVPDGQENSN